MHPLKKKKTTSVTICSPAVKWSLHTGWIPTPGFSEKLSATLSLRKPSSDFFPSPLGKCSITPSPGIYIVSRWKWPCFYFSFQLTCSRAVTTALLTAVIPLNGESVRGMSKQTIFERDFKVHSQKHDTSKAGVKVPLELITVVSVYVGGGGIVQ